MSDLLSSSKGVIEGVTETIKGLKAEMEQFKQQREDLTKEKHTLMLQPIGKADVKKLIFDHIDQLGKNFFDKGGIKNVLDVVAFPKREQSGLPKPTNTAINLYELDSALNDKGYFNTNIFGVANAKLPIFNAYLFGQGGMEGFYFYFGEIIKEKIEKHFDDLFPQNWEIYKEGAPLAERRKRIAEIDKALFELGESISKYDNQLFKLRALAKV